MLTLRYSYTNKANEKMVFLCKVQRIPRMTMGMIKQRIRARLENEVGKITDLKLIAQNDPGDILVLDAMGETED